MFIRDNLGNLIPPGRVRKQLEWDVWNDAALPTWLTSDQGTLTYPLPVSSAGGQGYVRATTGNVSGNKANVKLAFSVDLAVFAAVMFTVEGLGFEVATGIDAELSMFGGAGIGVALAEADGSSLGTVLQANGSSEGTVYNPTGSSVQGLRTLGRKNLSIAASGVSRHVAALQDDQELAYRRMATLTTGQVTPKIEITTKSATARYFQLARVSLTLWF